MQTLRIMCLFLGMFLLATPGAAAGEELGRTITVEGEGRAASAPDTAVIQTGVVTRSAAAGEALSANSKAMEKVMDVLKRHEIAAEDIQTASLSVIPEYGRDERGRRDPEIAGYRVTNLVRVRVRKLSELGQVLDALVKAGSNQIAGIGFEIDDPAAFLEQARRQAVADARGRAELYAQAAGVRLGRVLAISERPIDLPAPLNLARGMAAESVSAVPVAPGETEFRMTVHMVFALEDKP